MTTRKFGAISLVVGIAILSSQPRTASADALAAFVGSWSGSGTITVQDGTRERIRCRGAHKSNQSNGTLTLGLRCASDSYKFELQSDITYDGGNISGSWNEVTRQVHGSISGRATSNQIQAQASAIGFNASLSISTRGNSQSVSIKSPGSEISEVAISMARAGR